MAGGIVGGAGAFYLSKFNLARGEENGVRWTKNHFAAQFGESLLIYLAVAHFGRGRGEWEDGEAPEFWRKTVNSVLGGHAKEIEASWKAGSSANADVEKIRSDCRKVLGASAREVLEKLYPEVSLWEAGD